MSDFAVWRNRVAAVWSLTMDPPLPAAVRGEKGEPCAWLFPLLGALLGAAVALIGIATSSIFNPVAGALLFALLGIALWEIKDSGRETALIFDFIRSRFAGGDTVEALGRLKADKGIFQDPRASMMLMISYLIRFALLFALGFYGAALWMWVILTGVFTVEGYLALAPRRSGAAPLVPGGGEAAKLLWIAGALVLVPLLWSFPVAVPAAALIAVLAAREFGRIAETGLGGVDPELITFAGGVVGNVLLVAGIFFALTVR